MHRDVRHQNRPRGGLPLERRYCVGIVDIDPRQPPVLLGFVTFPATPAGLLEAAKKAAEIMDALAGDEELVGTAAVFEAPFRVGCVLREVRRKCCKFRRKSA